MSDSMEAKQDILSLAAQLGKFEDMPAQLPPVQSWNPELSGDMDMLIRADGFWVHEGDVIQREKLIRLFSTILKREGDDYYLVTPVEKWRIQVENTPFQVVLAQISGGGARARQHVGSQQVIRLITNVGDEIELDEKHKLELSSKGLPVVEIRDGLYATLNRNVYYQLAELAIEEDDQDGFYVISRQVRHKIG